MTSSAGGRAARARCRSCTGSAASTTSPSASCRTCAAGATRARSASATAPGTRPSSTSTASCSTRSTSTASSSASSTRRSRRSSPTSPTPPRARWRETDAGHVGDARRAAPPPLLEGAVLDGARPRGQARAAARRARARSRSGRPSATRSATRSSSAAGASSARRYAQSFDSDELDAAQLLMPIVGFLPATDERMRSTIDAIARDLTEDGLVLRYRNEEGLNADGLDGRGGHVRDLLVLARVLPRAGGRGRARRGAVRPARRLRERPRPAGRGDRHRERRAARQLPAGLQPHRPDHRRVGDRQGAGGGR